jgi:hypothetical protein
MKLVITILLLYAVTEVSAQYMHGKVIDGLTKRPISNVTVTTSFSLAFTQYNGHFDLFQPHIGDTLKFSCVGYKSGSFVYLTFNKDTLPIALQPQFIILNPVIIKALRDYKSDSLRNRHEYSSVFKYMAPRLKDAFINNWNSAYTPYSYNQAPNNTTALLSVNLLSLIALIGKDKTPISRLKKTLITDEEAGYVDRIFSKDKVSSITTLLGDSLQDFMDEFRPPIQLLKKMSGYEFTVYIKNSYQGFIKTYHHKKISPFKH